MVNRSVKLAEVLCAAYSLCRPGGISRAQFARFCKLRFGKKSRAPAYHKVLNHAVDQGLLTQFRGRYYLPRRTSSCICWADPEDTLDGRRSKRNKLHCMNKNTRVPNKVHRNQRPSRTNRNPSNRKQDRKKSNLYQLWHQHKQSTGGNMSRGRRGSVRLERNHQAEKPLARNITSTRNENNSTRSRRLATRSSIRDSKGCIYTKESRNQRKLPTTKHPNSWKHLGNKCHKNPLTKSFPGRRGHNTRQHIGRQNYNKRLEFLDSEYGKDTPRDKKSTVQLKRKQMKKYVRSRQEHPVCLEKRKYFPQGNLRSDSYIKNSSDEESSSAKLCRSRVEFYRRMLRQTKAAVPHAQSWDRLNHAGMRRRLENQELVKSSRLVQKILTNEHGQSWDDLNEKLRQIHLNKRKCNPSLPTIHIVPHEDTDCDVLEYYPSLATLNRESSDCQVSGRPKSYYRSSHCIK